MELAHEVIRSADLPVLKSQDALIIVDAAGRVVYNHVDETHFGEELEGSELVRDALSSQPVEALWSPSQVESFAVPLASVASGDLLLLLARPISRGRNLLGAVLVGRWVKPSFLPNLEKVVGDRVVLRAPDGALAATLEGAEMAAQSAPGERAKLVRIGATRYLVQAAQLAGLDGQEIGRAFLLRNFDAEMEPILRRFGRDAVKYSAIALAIAAGIIAAWKLRILRQLTGDDPPKS